MSLMRAYFFMAMGCLATRSYYCGEIGKTVFVLAISGMKMFIDEVYFIKEEHERDNKKVG